MTQTAQTTPTLTKSRRGRKKGWSPGITRKMTHQIGVWSWDHNKLISKLVPGPELDDCTHWQGAVSPAANLFGAYKQDATGRSRPQMTQVNRLLAMAETGEDLEGRCVFMRCGNSHCSNTEHFVIESKVGVSKREIYV